VTAGVFVAHVDNIGHALEAKNRAKGASAKQDKPGLMFCCRTTNAPHGRS
jgi:hypothetical protein